MHFVPLVNGSQHYEEAERLLGVAYGARDSLGPDRDKAIRAAHVHATLALAAATARIAANLSGLQGGERGQDAP